jgi:hypothetical protein
MDDLPPGAGIAAGVHMVSDVVATIFGAHPSGRGATVRRRVDRSAAQVRR